MIPPAIKDALDSLLGDVDSEEADKKRKKYAPPEEPKAHGVHITIVAGGPHKEPDGDEGMEDPGDLEKLLGDGEEGPPEEEPEEEEAPKPKKKPRRY